jgi:hypothetical protein
MSITINNESRQRMRMPFDIDFMANRYQTKNGIYTFTSPSLWTIEKNLFYLLKHSIEVDLEPKYVRKPWLLSYDQYGIVILEYLLMYVNGVFSSEDFDIATVVLPTIESIIEICNDKFSKITNVDSLEKIEW